MTYLVKVQGLSMSSEESMKEFIGKHNLSCSIGKFPNRWRTQFEVPEEEVELWRARLREAFKDNNGVYVTIKPLAYYY